ncbi:MFS transporter [Bordetella bronchialis]|uniref:MFS transporter n=2 Tax=Bordetella bronchialis TaxID=463025 RepID=A0A193FK93_9BORD|nr:MFS transporter [Bordetella bronchialis]ANN73180.1 MFS transporter [Bordetella bronchialis]
MFLILLLSYVLNAVDRTLFSVLAIEVRNAMGLSLPQVGLASTLFTLGMGLAAIPTGYLLGIRSRKSVVILGLAIFSLATLMTAYAQGLADLLAYRFISGLGEAMQATAIIAIGASYFYRHRALVTGSVSFAYGIGAFLGPTSTAALLNAYDWKKPFVVFGLVGAIAMVLVWIWVKPWFSESRENEAPANRAANAAARGANETIWNPTTVTLGLASICAGVAVYGFSGLYPTYLRNALGFTPAQAAYVMSAIGIGGFLAPLSGWLGDRLGYHKVLCLALPLAALSGGIAFTELDRSVYLHALAAGVFGVSVLSLLYSNLSAIIIESMTPAKTAQGSGMFIASYYIPAAFAGYLLAELKEIFGWTMAGIVQTSGFAILSMVLVLVATAMRRKAMLPTPDVELGAHRA